MGAGADRVPVVVEPDVRVPTGEPGEPVAQPVGHLVQRGGGDDQQAEQGEQDEDGHGEPDRDRLHQRGGHEEADQTATRAHGRPAVGRGREPGQHVQQRRGRGAEGEQADADATVLPLRVGASEQPQAQGQQHQRQHERGTAQHPGDGLVHPADGDAVDPEPSPGSHHRGRGQQQEAQAVTAVHRVELAGPVVDGPDQPADEAPRKREDAHKGAGKQWRACRGPASRGTGRYPPRGAGPGRALHPCLGRRR